MNTQTLISRLLELPRAIAEAEKWACDATIEVAAIRHNTKTREAMLLTSGEIEGKNAEERAACLRVKTAQDLRALVEAEATADRAKLALSALQTELSCLRAVAKLLARETE